MADKEERLLVLTTHNKDGECECVMQDGCHANDSCAICNVGMTRQEAVERMAKAIYFKACGTMKDYNKCKKEYIPFAEAALDALLGYK